MKLNKKQEEEVLEVYKIWLYSYLNGGIDTYNLYLDDDYRFVGSTDNEDFLDKNDATKFFEETVDQLAGKAEVRNSIIRLEQFDDLVFLTDIFDAYFLNENDWAYYGKFRFTSALKKNKEGWRFVYQHFSTPDSKAQEGETLGTEQISAENLQLREAIQRRTIELEQKNHELEIETALEKVRSVASSMMNPDDLLNVCEVLFVELKKLGFNELRNALINIIYDDEGYIINYDFSDHLGTSTTTLDYNSHPVIDNFLKQIGKTKDAFAEIPLNGKELEDWKKQRKSNGEAYDKYLEETDSLYYYFYSIGNGGIGISTFSSIDKDKLNILKRFRNVFDFAYRRYLDITLAQEQAREAQIEAALEKVRSRTMAMQKGEEVKDVVVLLYKELIALGVTNFATCGYVEINEKTNRQETWVTNLGGDSLGLFYLPLTGDVLFDERYEAWKRQQTVFHQTVGGKKRREHLEYAITTFNSKEAEEMVLNQFPDPTVFYCFNFAQGYLHLVAASKLKEEEESLLARFTGVFQQTYTRFLDLQKAEEQAREAQIETALERVRSRSMAMHQSKELAALSLELVKQVQTLGIATWFCAFNIYDEDQKGSIEWGSNGQGTFPEYRTPREGVFLRYYEVGQSGETLLVNVIDENECPAHYDYLCSLPGVGEQLLKMRDSGISFPASQIDHVAYFKYGYIIFVTYEAAPEAHNIFKRFANVFEQTYTRFLDLQKAEAQAREAQVELTLERIRAQVTTMTESADLFDIVVSMRSEFITLGCEADYFWHMRWLSDKYEMSMTSEDGSRLGMVITIPKSVHEGIPDLLKWEKTKDPTYVLALDVDQAWDYIENMNTYGHYEKVDPNAPTQDDIEHIGGLTFIIARTTHGEIGYSLPGVVPNPPQDDVDIIIRFAGVFDLAYRRFEDLKKAEQQARENQIELALERTRTQSMLMQHSDEIKNISEVFHQQLLELNIPTEYSYVWLPDESKQNHQFWASWKEEENGEVDFKSKQLTYPLDKTEAYTAACYNAWSTPETVHVEFIPPEDIPNFFNTWDELLDSSKNLKAENFKKGIYYSEAYMQYGCFGINIRNELSAEEKQVLKRFSIEFERSYSRFLDLQKAEEQAKEAQVELALERIRTQVTAMSESADLLDIVVNMRTEFVALGHKAEYFWYMRWHPEVYEKAMTSIDGAKIGMVMRLPRHIHGDIPLVAKWEESDEPTVVLAMDVETAVSYVDKMITLGDFEQVDPNAPTLDDIRHIKGLTFVMARTKHGEIGYSLSGEVHNPPQEDQDTLVRFAAVFDLAYRRFEDLKNAERRNRETEIELALERVRARTMAMYKSDELSSVASVLFEQMRVLGGDLFAFGIVLCDKYENMVEQWHSIGEEGMMSPFQIPVDLDYIHQYRYDKWKAGEQLFSIEIPEDYIEKHFELMFKVPSFEASMNEVAAKGIEITTPSWEIDYGASFSHGYLLVSSLTPFKEDYIFPRFAKVFEQAYTRFLDLKKAEQQTREAQIEAAVERIRAQSMAMHSPEDFGKVAKALWDQVNLLELEGFTGAFILLFDEMDYFTIWDFSNPGNVGKPENKVARYDPKKYPINGMQIMEKWKENQEYFVIDFDLQTLKKATKEWESIDSSIADTFKKAIASGQFEHQWNACGRISQGILSFDMLNRPNADVRQVMLKMAKAFEQAHIRFLDLQKADARTREAKIEGALERVRARAMAMQQPEELKDVAQVLRTEMGLLGVEELETCSIYINDVIKEKTECWYALKDISTGGKELVSDHFILSLDDTWVGREMLEFYNTDEKQTSIIMKGDNRKEWIDYCEKNSPPFRGYYGETIPERTYHLYKFSHGTIGAASAGDISTESWHLLERAASVFSLAYSRFNDLTKARIDLLQLKEEKKKAEDALTELRSTQTQLIQAEKMASLGELTAGIAHEIQNPLNFVNNFSEINSELIDELKEEVEKGNLEEIAELAVDIKENEERINHHGKRADAIVKGMLQHSRSSTGQKESTDLNLLCDEYLRLSYHGLRAKDKSFNATLKVDFDESIGKIDVIPQDLGRVVLNLINNAFFAVNDKKKSEIENYEPTVSVGTRQNDGKIEIIVKDNGPGIPKDVLDKIFQPFFTTKPSGEGTGLGLSLSYDIITKGHGGHLIVETKEGEGSKFIIQLYIIDK